MTTNQSPLASPAADTPQPAPAITPDAVVEQLRMLSSQIAEVKPLTPEQREVVRRQATARSLGILQASINVIGAADLVSQAVGHEAPEVRIMCDESNRWDAVEGELRAMLNGIAGANLIRRQRLAFIAERAYGVGSQLVRDPAHAALVPHVQEIKRLRKLQRRKKTAPAPETPAPAPGSATVADTSSNTMT